MTPAPHEVKHMICLQYRPTPRSRAWITAYRMHMAGLENMVADAETLHQRHKVHEWKILQEEVATGATVATLARCTVGQPVNRGRVVSEPFETEDTPEGTQTLVPGVAPIATRDRLERRQERPLTGGNEPCDRGLFDDGGHRQLDMLDLM